MYRIKERFKSNNKVVYKALTRRAFLLSAAVYYTYNRVVVVLVEICNSSARQLMNDVGSIRVLSIAVVAIITLS